MATAKQTQVARRAATKDAESDEVVQPRRKAIVEEPVDETITVTVEKPFILTDDDGKQHHIPAGIQEMKRSHAEHWFAKAHGTTEYVPKTAEELVAEAKAAEAAAKAAAKEAADK